MTADTPDPRPVSPPPELTGKPWLLRLTCCGRSDGVWAMATWEEADALRESYVDAAGHDRSAIIEDALAARAVPEPSRLREALAEDAELLHHYVHPETSFAECAGARCVRRRHLIDAARAAREPCGPDWDRLAQAWGNVMNGRHIPGHVTRIGPDTTTVEDWRNIAAEYAALQAEPARAEEGAS